MAAVLKHHQAVLATAAALVCASPRAEADFTWNGAGDGVTFSDGANWVGGAAPPLDLAGDTLVFGPTGAAQSPDILGASYVNITAIAFTGADAALTLSDAGVVGNFTFLDAGTITNDSAILQTINVDLVGTGSTFFLMALTGSLDIGGDIDLSDTGGVQLGVFGDMDTTLRGLISGAGASLLKQGNGVLVLEGANTYDGGTELAAGTIVLADDSALGTGDLNVTGDGAIESDDDARAVANGVTLDASTLTFSGANDLELLGVIGGDGSLHVNTDADDVTLMLSGLNLYSGGTTLTRGTILISSASALGTGDLTVAGNGSIQSDADGLDVTNNISIADLTSLTFSGASNLGLTGVISGDGGLIINGDAPDVRLRLLGNNTYTGGTTLMQGTIVVDNDNALGTGDLTLAGDGAIEARSNDRQLANNIVLDTFELTFAGDRRLELDGVISGVGGSLLIDAADDVTSLTLRGDNTYDGGTTLNRGILVLGHDHALGTGNLTLTGAGTIQSDDDAVNAANAIDNGGFLLTFSGGSSLELSGAISGAGGLTIDGDAGTTLTLSSMTNSYTGATDVLEGTLNLAGFIDSQVTVADGATIMGTGTVDGDVTVLSGGTLAPGASIGTFTVVNGNLLLDSGATMVVELSADSLTSDLVDVSGAAGLDAGSTIMADVTGTSYIPTDQTFTIIHADAGVFDAGADITTDSVTVTVEIVRDQAFVDGQTDYALQLFRSSTAYSDAANPGNNTQIGFGLDSQIPIADADPGGPTGQLLGTLDTLDSSAYNAAVTGLSPVSYNAVKSTGTETIRDFTTEQAAYLAARRSGTESWPAPTPPPGPPPGSMALAQNDPLLLAAAIAQSQPEDDQDFGPRPRRPDSRWSRYAKFEGISMNQDTGTNQTGFDAFAIGGQAGMDYSFSKALLAGAAIGYAYTDVTLNGNAGTLNDNAIRVGPYASYTQGNWFVDASVTWAWHFYNGRRNIPAPIGMTASSNYDGWDLTAYAGGGYHFEVAKDLHLTPMASMLYSYFNFDSFTETGAGGANLTLGNRSAASLRSRLGGSIAYRLDWQWMPIPYLYAAWEHEYLDDSDIEATFAAGGSPFFLTTGTPDRDAFVIGGGVNMLINPKVAAFVRFESIISSTSNANAFAVGLSVAF